MLFGFNPQLWLKASWSPHNATNIFNSPSDFSSFSVLPSKNGRALGFLDYGSFLQSAARTRL